METFEAVPKKFSARVLAIMLSVLLIALSTPVSWAAEPAEADGVASQHGSQSALAANANLTISGSTDGAACPGDSGVAITFAIAGNPGIAALDAALSYDESALTLTGLTAGTVLGSGTFFQNVAQKCFSWMNASNVTTDGVLFTALFDVDEGAQGDFTISLTVTNLSNELGQAVSQTTSPASLAVTLVQTSLEDCTVSELGSLTYTGLPLTPALTILNGTTMLSEGTDYDVTYAQNTNLGTAVVTATGKGRYTDSVSATFEIVVPDESTAKLNNGSDLAMPKLQLPTGFDPESAQSADLRISAGIDDLNYISTGILFSATALDSDTLKIGEVGVHAFATKTVYSALYVNGQLKSASSVFGSGYSYASAVTMTGIPATAFAQEFAMRAFVIASDGSVYYGETMTFTIHSLA